MTKTFFSSLTFQIKYLYENGKPQLYEGMNQIFGKTYKHYSPIMQRWDSSYAK